MSRKALESGNDFLRKYNAKNSKRDRQQGMNDGAGNFRKSISTGDLEPTRYLTKHAKERMAERGVSVAHAIKGTAKSGAVIAPNGAVVTVIPEAWSSNRRNEKNASAGKSPRSKSRIAVVPKEDELPKDHALVEVTSVYMGLLLGKEHADILKRTQKYPRTKYAVIDGTLWIWGPNEKVKSLRHDIEVKEQEVIDKYGPPVPNDALPAGHTRRRIVIPEIAAGHVIGKKGNNIKKLREECDSLSISMNSRNIVMNVWGESSAVDRICKAIATSVEKAKRMKKRNQLKTAAVAKRSLEKRMGERQKKAKQKKGESPSLGRKEKKRKQKQAARQARSLLRITKEGKANTDTEKKTQEPKSTKKNKKKKAQGSKKASKQAK
jgi:hypothetical protein